MYKNVLQSGKHGAQQRKRLSSPIYYPQNIYAIFHISLIWRTIISCLLETDDLQTWVCVKQGLHPTEAGHTETCLTDFGADSPLKIPSKSVRNSKSCTDTIPYRALTSQTACKARTECYHKSGWDNLFQTRGTNAILLGNFSWRKPV
jgi:hypothetical protein